MTIDSKNKKYTENIEKWNLINDVCDSQNLDKYILELDRLDKSVENIERNKTFKKRAVFSAVAGYTSRGLIGKAFAKTPSITVPDELSYVNYDVDGAGASIYQQSQDVVRDVLRIGRSGLLIDFPTTEGEVSRADINSQNIFATITRFDARQIINWQLKRVGSKLQPVLITLQSSVNESMDGYEYQSIEIIIELCLTDGVYEQKEWRLNDKKEWTLHLKTTPKDGSGASLDYIPFVFVGSECNTSHVDHPPMYDLAKINVGHLNNSAIYEDSVFTVGQVQPWMSGLNQETIDLMKDNNMRIGSGRLIGVPSGEVFDFAQASPNMLAREAMNDKITMMIGLGAMYMQTGSVAKTASQVDGELMAQHSVLSLIAHNVSEAYSVALKMAGQFMGVSGEAEYQYNISQDFIEPETTPQMLTAMVASFLQGVLPISDLYEWKKKHGLVNNEKSLEDYQDEIGMQESMPDLEDD
jgi:hypothetical protein